MISPEQRIYFYPHPKLRDRQLDTVRHWPAAQVLNPDVIQQKPFHYGPQKGPKRRRLVPWSNWKRWLPLINIKLRPKPAPKDVPVYCWGGLIATGLFIVEMDNPYCLTGYNAAAYHLYAPVLRALLLSKRCVQIRCISAACRETLRQTLGEKVAGKAQVFYPVIHDGAAEIIQRHDGAVRLLYISSQFELKAGPALLRAFKAAYAAQPNLRLTLITYLPDEYGQEVHDCAAITVMPSNLPRAQILHDIMPQHDVLVHPTFAESFGMVVREAVSQGLAIISTDVYAIREMVAPEQNGSLQNGFLLPVPISTWDGFRPSYYFRHPDALQAATRNFHDPQFEKSLSAALIAIAEDPEKLLKMRQASLECHHGKLSNVG